MKELIWKILPASVRRFWSKRNGEPVSGWFGDYPDWKAAEQEAGGYNASEILQKVSASLMKVKRGEAAFERDSVAFDTLELQPDVQQWLKKIAEENNHNLNVLDFGGSLGSTYFQYRNSIGENKIQSWTVVEQTNFVEEGKAKFEDEILRFCFSVDEAVQLKKPDALLLFSVLPYIEEPFRMIEQILASGIEYIIVDRNPFLEAEKDRITLQIVPEYIYKASYPAWFFNEVHFLVAFAEKYEVVHQYNSKFANPITLSDGTRAAWKGFVFKRR